MDSSSLNTYKLNFDGDSKGNPGLVGFRGAVRSNESKILGAFSRSLGITKNNATKLEGLLVGFSWDLDMNWTPIIVEGESLLIINMAARI